MKKRTELLNYLIKKYNYKRYLEIGVGDKSNFNRVQAEYKDGVDPQYICTYRMESNTFFKTIGADKQYDIVFVDGSHRGKHALMDIENSIKHLSPNGIVVVHDCNPMRRAEQSQKPRRQGPWYGTVWKAIATLRMNRKDLFVCVIDMDCGCGIVKRGKQILFPPSHEEMNFKFLDNNRKELLNLITVKEFLTMDI
jgi:hypothetical protein